MQTMRSLRWERRGDAGSSGGTEGQSGEKLEGMHGIILRVIERKIERRSASKGDN
jgi:hypothetical protein